MNFNMNESSACGNKWNQLELENVKMLIEKEQICLDSTPWITMYVDGSFGPNGLREQVTTHYLEWWEL